MTLIARAGLIWLVILCLAVINGLLREQLLIPRLGQTTGLLLSGLLLSALILGVTFLTLPWMRLRQASDSLVVGLGWLVLTLGCEFSLAWLQGKSWQDMLHAYTGTNGNLWPLVLLVTTCAPWMASRCRPQGQANDQEHVPGHPSG